MSTKTFEFTLAQQAKSKGGDKYVCTTNPEFNIYVPQTDSRVSGVPVKSFVVTITPKE
jgi:hypothetical protein